MQNYKILQKINKPSDLEGLSFEELNILSKEIAHFLVHSVSKTGGHLSSNLGIVDLTIAMHKVFDTTKDRFVFDVGHQSYVHKILTGRKDRFDTLRKKGGLSGFTKPDESVHDAFVSGHASVSISAALGMAHARTLKKEGNSVVALIGDGALTGGLAYEALNNAGLSSEPLIVILNDNKMSITENVGAVSRHLYKLRTSSSYLGTKKTIQTFLAKTSNGDKIYKLINSSKRRLKSAVLPTSVFEQMGFTYIGPVDGHNIKLMCNVLKKAKELQKPVLIHVITKKGKGYRHSEECPDIFHGVSKFDVKTGEMISKSSDNFSANFGDTLVKIAQDNPKVCAITAAMSSGTGLIKFSNLYPERFFDVGIAESHAVTMSAGLAISSMTPVCALYSTFLQRAYDQLIHDVAISNLHVVFAIDRAGIVGDDGETHNGVFDIPMLLSIPNFTILAPSNYKEQASMLEKAISEFSSPVCVRYPRGSQGEFSEDTSDKDYVIYNDVGVVTVITYGMLINQAYELIEEIGIKLIKINNLSIDLNEIIQHHITDKLIFVEDCINTGSLGQKMLSHICQSSKNMKYIKIINTGDKFTKQATLSEVYKDYGIDKMGIKENVREALLVE